MRSIVSRWFLFGLLIGWSLTHASVFGQPTDAKVPHGADKLRQGLEKTIAVDFSSQSITEVVNHLRDRAGLPISVDEQSLLMMGMHPGDGLVQHFHVKANNEKAGAVLRKFLNNYRLCYVIFEDTILVTSEEMAVVRQMRQRVSVNVEDVPLKKVLRDLAKTHGINLVFDPTAGGQESPVSLQVENTGVETAVRLLAELASLKAVRMGNVMFVTSEAKAKKIREEEAHQFDNPLNPNVPGGQAIMGFGGGFGGIAIPPRAVVPGIAVPGNAPPPAPPIELPPEINNKGVPKPRDEPSSGEKKVIVPVPPQAPPVPPVPPRFDRPSTDIPPPVQGRDRKTP